MAISRFEVEIGDKFTMINSNSNIKETDFLSRTLVCKLEIGMKIIESFQKIIKFFFTGCPNEKNTAGVSTLQSTFLSSSVRVYIYKYIYISTKLFVHKFLKCSMQ